MFHRPVAVDSGTLVAGENVLHIAGVEPIAPQARCARGSQSWPCGARARTAFRAWLRGRSVLCNIPPDFAASPDTAVPCLVGEQDVGEWLVANGWASASGGSRYAEVEQRAREERKGIWQFDIDEAPPARADGF